MLAVPAGFTHFSYSKYPMFPGFSMTLYDNCQIFTNLRCQQCMMNLAQAMSFIKFS
jgi:hypothetical protein